MVQSLAACYGCKMNPVSLRFDPDIAVITVDDGKANALNGALFAGINDALDAAGREGKAVVLAGRAGFFSGGLDLKTLPLLAENDLFAVLEQFGRTMLRLFVWERPLVIACTGHAIAGGMVMALTGDERIGAAGNYKIGLNETAIGVQLPRFIAEMVRVQVDVRWHRSVLVEGAVVTPDRAHTMGLLDEVVAAEAVLDRALARARTLAALPPPAYKHNKLMLRQAAAEAGRAVYRDELRAFVGNVQAIRAGRL